MRRSCQEEMLRETARRCHDVKTCQEVSIYYVYIYIHNIYIYVSISSHQYHHICMYVCMYVSISSTYVYVIMNINHH